MSGVESTQHSVIDELVFVGRSEPADDDDDYRNRPAYVAVVIPEVEERPLSRQEQVTRALGLVVVFAALVLAIGLAIGYAA